MIIHAPRIYIMGPMTGMPDMNREAFAMAEGMALFRGMTPINPHSMETPAEDGESREEMYRRVMPGDIYELSTCDFVLALPGWERSRGCALEAHAADLMGIPLVSIDDDSTEYMGPLDLYIEERLNWIEDSLESMEP